MPSTFTASLRLTLQATGEGNNVWGNILNVGTLALIDTSIAGWFTKALTGDYTLSTSSGSADEARSAMFKFTGAGTFSVTVPGVSKRYEIWNATTGVLTITNGSVSVTVQVGEVVSIITDGSAAMKRVVATDFGGASLINVNRISGLVTPIANGDAATKKYVDDTAFAGMTGTFPGQSGNAGKFLTTDGTAANWGDDVSGFAASPTIVRAGTDATKAMTPGDTYNALAEVTLTDAETIAVDMATLINAAVTLGGNRTLGNPTNPKVGQSGFIRLIQDGTGSRTLAFGGNWRRPGGAATLTTTAGAIDVLEYQVLSATYILYNVLQNPS